ncbi:aa3-type cytochrome c oxidase subunit IV [Hoeflea sp. WL0058]|uniref:Aa3-type cytochrome c oxidase subunit IV n=1 Tax=Flavimaribacter sediminis TaxID=2865987 RepID=A0AAE2ZTE1_9HYPH|nr:aa3-type cytochrome c oxidase subunit IV [Flavimaribacter sediminis]MBW8639227.1 aa3-type cytochrome c oxidase subunit IV [Flavimaribacter sediminis]
MAEESTGPVETGADMDYAEHQKTYEGFLSVSKYGTMAIIAILLGMAIGFFTSAGFIFSSLLTIVLIVIGVMLLR